MVSYMDDVISNPVLGFESRIFAASRKHAAKHFSFNAFGISIVTDDGSIADVGSEEDMFRRQAAMKVFNRTLRSRGGRLVIGRPCLSDYTVCFDEEAFAVSVREHCKAILDSVSRFCREKGCYAAVVLHLSEEMDGISGVPQPMHVHVLYERRPGMRYAEMLSWLEEASEKGA